jgi:hypothetical protein
VSKSKESSSALSSLEQLESNVQTQLLLRKQEEVVPSNATFDAYTKMVIKEEIDKSVEDLSPKFLATKRGSLQLWQFLLNLLCSKRNETIIEWTRKSSAEFKLLDPEEVFIIY